MPLTAVDFRDQLLTDTLPFWMQHGLDHEHGGVFSSLDRDGSRIDSDKSVWVQGRFGWLLGELYNHPGCAEHVDEEQRAAWLNAAQSCAKFIDDHCVDPSDGRLYFHMTREGRPLRKRRYAFTESFAAIAFGELAQATGDDYYAKRATESFQRFVDHTLNPTGVQPKFTDVRPTQNIGFPMIAIGTAQQLRDSIGLPVANEWIDRSIDSIRTTFMKPDIECVMETVGANGELLDHFDGRTLNPGHAIEGAWFIMAEGERRNDEGMIQTGCQMLDWMWKRGWDEEFGGMMYFVGVDGKPVQEYWHDMKFWWTHNETIIATLMAAELSGESRYRQWYEKICEWSYKNFADAEHGEWYGYLRRDGSVSLPLKGNLWKGPFHLPRMQLVCWDLLAE